MTDLQRALDFVRTIEERCAEEIVSFPYGRAFFNDSFARVWDLNLLVVETDELPSAEELVTEAERLHTARGHEHRRLTLPAGGERLLAELRGRGWFGERLLLMAHRRAPALKASSAVEELKLDDPGLRAAREEFMLGEPWTKADEEARAQLLDAKGLVARATRLRSFGASAEGELASYCDLYSDGATAQIEHVSTLKRFRGRGLATSVVLRALEVARAEGHDLVFLLTDADDWPKELYSKLGFETIGERFALLFPPKQRAA
jgi:ribosomal protein S18 acetylase RimI-like enzyme